MCNPTKCPGGKFGLMSKREVKWIFRKHINQRLLDADGRFAKSIEYWLIAQYIVASKRVADDAYSILRQTQGRLNNGRVLTAGTIRNQQVLQQIICCMTCWFLMGQIICCMTCWLLMGWFRGMNGCLPHFEKFERFTSLFPEGDVRMYLAWSDSLGYKPGSSPVSSDIQRPDVIQTIARQYGTTLPEGGMESMSFKDESRWLRQNPVTAARHFQFYLSSKSSDIDCPWI